MPGTDANMGIFQLIPFVLAAITTAGAVASTAISLKALFSSGGGNKQAEQQQKVLDTITPSVVNQLQNQGITLPPGSEQDWIRAALSGQLPASQYNQLIPLAIAGLGLIILVKK